MSLSRVSLRLSLRPITLRPAITSLRFASSGPTTKTKQDDHPPTTQGHATQKGHNLDVQTEYASKGQQESTKAGDNGQGEGQPFDAARMSGSGGEQKSGSEGKGPFKDQVGGQAGGESRMGGKEETAGGSTGDMIKKALGVGKDERHQSVMSPSKNGSQRQFHTSTRIWNSSPKTGREPKESASDLHGDQNQHLKHTSNPGPDQTSGKGNAAADPHLPSKSSSSSSSSTSTPEQTSGNPAQSGKASGQVKGFAAFHTSSRVGVKKQPEGGYVGSHESEPAKAGYDTPPEALPPNLESAYNRAESEPAKPNLTPSSEAQYSSTAQDPPNQALKGVVTGGGMDPRNPQPSGDVGKQGLDEAWKKRQA